MKKYNIGIIGTENSHADGFCRLFNEPQKDGNFLYPDCKVTVCYGNYPEANETIAKKYPGVKIAANIEEIISTVDAVMVTARDGKYHAGFAKPFIEKGIPAFVDKPFASDVKEAVSLVELAKEKGVLLCGGSSLKYSKEIAELKNFRAEKGVKGGFVAAPVNFKNEYGDFWFYASHLAEMCMEVFGWDPVSVYAKENGESVFAIANYDNFSVTCNFINHCYSAYSGGVFVESESLIRSVGLDGIEKAETDEFVNMLNSGKTRYGYDELIAPVRFIAAVKRSYETGKEIKIQY